MLERVEVDQLEWSCKKWRSIPRSQRGNEYIHSFVHLVVCLTTGPKLLPNRAFHIVRSRAFSFKWEYPPLFLRSSSSFLRLLPRLPVTSIPPFIFPSITRCREKFLHKMWPIQVAFRLRISCRIFLCSLTLSNTSSPMNILQSIKRNKAKWIGQILRRNCLLKHFIEGKIEGRIEVMGKPRTKIQQS